MSFTRILLYISAKKSQLLSSLFLRLSDRLVRKRAVRVIAWFLRHSLARIAFAKSSSAESPMRVIVLTKSIFIDDVMLGLAPQGGFDLFHLDRRLPKALVRPFLPYQVRDNSYKSDDPRMAEGKLAARRFLDELIPHFARAFPFDAMITGNVVYWAEQELAGCLDRYGIAFVACHKESIQAPDLWNEMVALRQQGNDQFQGTLALVYNRKTATQLIAGKMLQRDKIAAVGMPRLDRIHALRQSGLSATSRPLVLCFLISRISQLRVLIDKSDPRRWARLSERTHDSLLELARENPSVDLVVKYKSTDQGQVDELLARWAGRIPANLRFTLSENLYDLLRNCSLVVGHNTTAIFEAIAAGRSVVVPHYDEACEPDFQGRLLDFGNAVIRAYSPEELQRTILEALMKPKDPSVLSADAQDLLIEWLGNHDGRASERMEFGIREAVRAKRENRPVDVAVIEGGRQ